MEFAVSGPVVRSVRQRTVSDIGCRARVPRAGEPHHVLPANALRKENRLRSRRGTGGSGSRRNLVCTTRELDVRIRSETVVLPRITFVSPRCTENDGHDGAHSVPVSPSLRPMSTAGLTTGLRHTSAGLDAANAVVQHSLSTREKSAPSRATLPCGARQMVAVSDAADIGIRAAAPVPVAPAALSFGNGPSGDNPQRMRPPSVWGPRRTFEAPRRREAFCVLAEHFAYDNVDYWSDKSWRPSPGVQRDKQSTDTSTWPIDAPVINLWGKGPFIDKEECEKQSQGTKHGENVKYGLGLISGISEYTKLRDPTKPLVDTPARESRDLHRHKQSLLANRYITPIARHRVKKFVVGFTVPKPKKMTLRGVLDGRPQNAEQVRPPDPHLAGLERMRELTLEFPLCQELDGISYFNQFQWDPEIAAHWVVKLGKERFTWDRMAMGWSHAVFVSHTVTEWLCDIPGHPDAVIMAYIDNVYVFGRSHEAINALTAAFLDRCKSVNAAFEVTTPTADSLVILGVQCDTRNKTFALPQTFLDKFKKVLTVLDDCFLSGSDNQGLPTTEIMWKVFGALMWGTRVLGIHLYKYGVFMNWLSRRASQLAAMPHLWTSPCAIWPSALSELRELIGVVLVNEPNSIVPQLNADIDHIMFTDASNTGFGVVHCGQLLTSTTSKAWTSFMKNTIIAEKELFALVEGVREAKASLSEVKKILAYNDNTNVIAWVKRRRGKSSLSNRLIRDLFKLLGSTTLVVEYVASAENIADEPSRRMPNRIQC